VLARPADEDQIEAELWQARVLGGRASD